MAALIKKLRGPWISPLSELNCQLLGFVKTSNDMIFKEKRYLGARLFSVLGVGLDVDQGSHLAT